MRKTSAGLLLNSFCLLFAVGHNLQGQTDGPSRSYLTQRETKLDRAVSERYREIMKLLQPEAKKKLATTSRALLKEMENKPEHADLEKLARAQVEKEFVGLSGAQLDILSFYILANAAQSEKELLDTRDSLSELGEQEQLKMQMVMDRMTKADSAASNALKKFSETAGQIIGNIK
jgi:hypothetical protein